MSVRLFKIEVKGKISKNQALDDVISLVHLSELQMGYEEYVEPAIVWVTEDSTRIARSLDVEKVVVEGGYVSGVLGGERKRSKPKYAGLVLKYYKQQDGIVFLHLTNLKKTYQVPLNLMKLYNVNIYKMYYVGLINPFVCKTHNVLLSAKGDDDLKKFLEQLMLMNQGILTKDDRGKLELLIKELKTTMDMFDPSSHYVIYRRDRVFTACVPSILEMAVSDQNISYIKCRSLEQAYYYAAVLNYLAYKVAKARRTFIHHQYGKPLVALIIAGLSWNKIPYRVREEIAKLSEILSKRLTWKEYPNQKKALEDVGSTTEFREIVSMLDRCISKEDLERALDLISERPRR